MDAVRTTVRLITRGALIVTAVTEHMTAAVRGREVTREHRMAQPHRAAGPDLATPHEKVRR